jgi:hypothetical protein
VRDIRLTLMIVNLSKWRINDTLYIEYGAAHWASGMNEDKSGR